MAFLINDRFIGVALKAHKFESELPSLMLGIMYNSSITPATILFVGTLYIVIHLCYTGRVFMGNIEKKRTKKTNNSNLVVFRATEDVQGILENLAKDGRTVADIANEAIRLNGTKAALSVLERQAKEAQDKFQKAQDAFIAASKKSQA